MEPRYLRFLLGSLLSAGLACSSSADSATPTAIVEPASGQSSRPTLPAITPVWNTVSAPPDVTDNTDQLKVDAPRANGQEVTGLEVNVVEVSESFYRLVWDDADQGFRREATSEARPGELIELVISAVNLSDQALADIELINSVPSGPLRLLTDSFQWDASKGLYRISRDGETFFPADAELDPADIHFIQWLIFSLRPAESLHLAYRLQLDP